MLTCPGSGSARHREGGSILAKESCPPQLCVHFLVGLGGGPVGSCGTDTVGKLPRASLKTTHSHEGHSAKCMVKDMAFCVSALWVVTITHDTLFCYIVTMYL